MTQKDVTSLPYPISSAFNEFSTSADIISGINLTGKTVIVTGGYAGLGLETTQTLAGAGATVIVPARDQQKAFKNLAEIPTVEVEALDLADPLSIDAFAKRFLYTGRPLDLLINNAGVMWLPFSQDARGYETHLAVNHLGHFQLTARLWPALQKATGARVINVSSRGHRYSPFDFEDPHFNHKEYQTLKAYGQSKTANILFTVALDTRGKESGVRSFAVHPGSIVETDLARFADIKALENAGIFDAAGKPVHDPSKGLKTIAQGASTQIWCAVSPQLNNKGGVYCENNNIAVLHHEAPDDQLGMASLFTGVMPYAVDPEYAEQLWTLSEQLTGIAFRM